MFKYFTLHSIVLTELEKKEKNESGKFDVENNNFQENIDKVIVDLDKAINIIKIKLLKVDILDDEVIKFKRKLRFYELQVKFFKNLKTCAIILKIIHLTLREGLNENDFLKISSEVKIENSFFYYNITFLLYYYLFFDKSKDVYGDEFSFLKKYLENLLSFEVLNICTQFNNDYFRIDSFIDVFYEFNFSSCLLGDDNEYIDGIFFKKNKIIENYKLFIQDIDNIHILVLQINVVEMLKNLLINFDSMYERKVAHYTNYNVAKMLATNGTSLRLASTDHMNDPTEGKILFKFLHLNEMDFDSHNKTFLTCFTLNHNSLNQFRLYGLDMKIPCSGVSLVYGSKFFFNLDSIFEDYFSDDNEDDEKSNERLKDGLKVPLFRCIYLDSFTGHFEVAKRNKFTFYQEIQNREAADDAWDKYIKLIKIKEDNVEVSFKNILSTLRFIKGRRHNLSIDELRSISKIFKPISFLVKHFSFQEEQECRMIILEKIESDNVIMDVLDTSYSYIEYDQPTDRDIRNIYIGLASASKMIELIKIIKLKCKGECPKTMISDNPYRV